MSRRRKDKGKKSASSSSAVPGSDIALSGIDANRWYEGVQWTDIRRQMFKRGIETGRLVDVDFFGRENNFLIMTMLDKLNLRGLVDFAPEERRVYYDEVKQFYCYLDEMPCGSLRTYVNGIVFSINGHCIEDALKIGGKGKFLRRDYNKNEAMTLLGVSRFKAFELDVNMHILHTIITFNILPVGGHRDAITEDHLQLLYYLHQGIRPSIGDWLIRNMMNSKRNKQKNLPYGMLLTRLFLNHRVPLEGRDWIDAPPAIINSTSIALMGIRRDPQNDDKWLFKGRAGRWASRVEVATEVPAVDDSDEEDQEMHAAFDEEMNEAESVVALTAQMHELSCEFSSFREENVVNQNAMDVKFGTVKASMDQGLAAVRGELSGLTSDVNVLRREQNRTSELLSNVFELFKKK